MYTSRGEEWSEDVSFSFMVVKGAVWKLTQILYRNDKQSDSVERKHPNMEENVK